MKKRLIYISPVSCGNVLAVFAGCGSLINFAFPLFKVLFFTHQFTPRLFINGMLVSGLVCLDYALLGLVLGRMLAVAYNFLAKVTGGVRFTVEGFPSNSSPDYRKP